MRKPSTAVVVSAAVVLVAALVTAVVLVAGRDTSSNAGASSAAPTAGCSEVSTEELYVQHAYSCQDGTRVLTFATTQGRDDYLKVAEGFGTVTVDKGATWARVRI